MDKMANIQRLAVLATLLLPAVAQATNGYFSHGYSASQRALDMRQFELTVGVNYTY